MFRLRSCASSMMMVSYFLRSGSVCVSASRMPSVISLTHAPSDKVSVKRTLKPTCWPGGVPSSCAMRFAVLDAAMRRGWVWPIRPCWPRPISRQILGSWVVLPEPVSPATIMTWCSLRAFAISARRPDTGNSSGKVIGGSGWRGAAGAAGRARRELFFLKGSDADMSGRIIMPLMENSVQFVQWLRSVAPYIHAFRGKTFVVAFPGELVMAGALPVLAHDLALLHALGIKIVLVYGARPQVQEQMALRQNESRFHEGIRITDAAAMECVKEASGEIRLDIEGAFSQGLPNTPMAHADLRIISGNFVIARPMGVIEGVDLELTGVPRKVAFESIHRILAAGALVVLPPLGYSPTGEIFNLTMEDVAVATATALRADKLIFLTEHPLMKDQDGLE